MWQRTSCKADEEEIEFGEGVIICDKIPPFSYITPINSGENTTSHKVLILHKESRMKDLSVFQSLLLFSCRKRTVFAAKKSHDFPDLERGVFAPNLSLNRWGNPQ